MRSPDSCAISSNERSRRGRPRLASTQPRPERPSFSSHGGGAGTEQTMNDLLDFVLEAHGGLMRWSDCGLDGTGHLGIDPTGAALRPENEPDANRTGRRAARSEAIHS